MQMGTTPAVHRQRHSSNRCPVGGAELLVHEAILAGAVGAVTFRGAYQGGMPTSGCPGCHGETMADVDQES